MCRAFWCEHMVSEKFMGRIILVSSLAQHTETVTSCLALCGLKWDFLQFSICYSENQDPLTWKQAFLLSIPSVRCVFLSHTLWKYHFTKFSLPLGCVSLSLWTMVVWVTGCECSSFVAYCADDADMPVCFSHQTKQNIVMEMFPIQHPFSWVFFLCCMEPVVWNLFTYL